MFSIHAAATCWEFCPNDVLHKYSEYVTICCVLMFGNNVNYVWTAKLTPDDLMICDSGESTIGDTCQTLICIIYSI